MAYTKKTTATTDSTEKATKTTEVKEDVKTFLPEDTIPCRSLVSGGLYIEGARSHILYSWADCGDVVDVEYRDLIYLVRTREDVNIYSPRIIIEDEDFVEQNKSVKALKGIASTMIESHALDSVHRIKALDEIFGTKMLLTLVQE